MKTILKFTMILLTVGTLVSCTEDESIPTESQLDTTPKELSELDQWIRDNYTVPYNIEVIYKWNENEVDQDRYLYPPKIENVKPALEVIKKVWLDTYSEVGGEDFVKKVAPRQLVMVGGINLNQSATRTLGLAEGGKKITFFETDLLDITSRESIIEFMSTIQHEYAHILNQTKPFDTEAYGEITPSNYTAQWFNNSIEDSRELGYITHYARSNVSEDFAEMVKSMLITSDQEWNDLISEINSEQARIDIRTKEDMVADYYQKSYNVSIYDLQDKAYEHTLEIVNE